MNEQLITFFYKWHRFEQANNIAIIDFDLVQQGNNHREAFTSREEAEEQLQIIINNYNALPQRDIVVKAKLEASLYYLQALMGKQIPFNEYVSKTMGILPRYIPEEVLQQKLSQTKQAYEKVGYTWNKEEIGRFAKENSLSKEQIEEDFIAFRNTYLPQVLAWLDLNVDLKYKVSFVDRDEYWMNWISTDENGEIYLQYNLNKRHRWLKGSTELLVFHEICSHALQVSSWKEQLQRGSIHPFLGLISVFSSEQFIMEGIAQSLHYFFPRSLFSDYGLVILQADNLSWMVWNNAHIMANIGEEKRKIVEFIQSYLPSSSQEAIEKNIQEKTQEPLGRTYQYIYGISLYYHILIANKLSTEQKKHYVLENFRNIYLPKEIIEKYAIDN